MLVGDLHGLLALERLLTGKHFVDHDADGVDITTRVGNTASDELWRKVCDRTEQGSACRRVGGCRARETEVADLDAAVVGEKHVLWLEVSVNDSRLVRSREAGEHGFENVEGLLCR